MDAQLIGTIGTALVALFVGLATARAADRKDRKSDAQGLIDQLQEERNAAVVRADAADTRHATELAAQRAEHREEMGKVRDQMTALGRRHRVLEDYVGTLRVHIDQRLEPPAPAWPDELRQP